MSYYEFLCHRHRCRIFKYKIRRAVQLILRQGSSNRWLEPLHSRFVVLGRSIDYRILITFAANVYYLCSESLYLEIPVDRHPWKYGDDSCNIPVWWRCCTWSNIAFDNIDGHSRHSEGTSRNGNWLLQARTIFVLVDNVYSKIIFIMTMQTSRIILLAIENLIKFGRPTIGDTESYLLFYAALSIHTLMCISDYPNRLLQKWDQK